jgi:hypothetical protein
MTRFRSLIRRADDARSRWQRSRPKPPRVRPAVERLEGRRLLATFTVTNTGDNNGVDPAAGAGTGTLRQAIVDANAAPNPNNGIDMIVFAIGNGVQTIRPLKAGLPTIKDPVVIDGTPPANMPKQQIVIDGSKAVMGANGLTITASGSTVMGLTINQFMTKDNGNGTFTGGDGILLSDKGGNTIRGNYIGTDVTGTKPLGNTGNGVEIKTDSDGNTIGAALGQGNTISGNGLDGVAVYSSDNFIQDNFIGTDATGMKQVPNTKAGVDIIGAGGGMTGGEFNEVGGLTAKPGQPPGNVISANGGDGVLISGVHGSSNKVMGNIIGLNLAGTAPLGNKGNGVEILGGSNNTIGGTDPTARNVISANVGTPDKKGQLGNTGNGVLITNDTDGATTNKVQGNFIGTDITGTLIVAPGTNLPLGNVNDGVLIFGASGTIVGGNTLTPGAAPGNVISGNTGYLDNAGTPVGGNGVEILGRQGTRVRENTVAGNIIGADVTGTKGLGNRSNGVLIDDGNDSAEANTIGGTMVVGPLIPQPTNIIGGSPGLVGGKTTKDAPFKDGNGVKINGPNANKNLVLGNYIGTRPGAKKGDRALANSGAGVRINGGTGNVIGGKPSDPNPRLGANVISNNNAGGTVVGDGKKNPLGINSFFNNAPGLGIDLGDDGVTPNDSRGHDGPNNFQNFPVLTSATDSPGGGTVITGTLNSAPNTTFSIEFYDNSAPNPSGHGEGETFLDALNVTTDPSGFMMFTFVTSPGAPMGHFIAATATDPDGNTSEFSADVAVDLNVSRGGFSYSHATNRYVQVVTVQNVSDRPIAGPLALVLDNLVPNATLFNPSGTYQGSPYVLLNTGQALQPGQGVKLVLQFTNPTNLGITYDTRVVQLQPTSPAARVPGGGGGMLSAAGAAAPSRAGHPLPLWSRGWSVLPSLSGQGSVLGVVLAPGPGQEDVGPFARGGYRR